MVIYLLYLYAFRAQRKTVSKEREINKLSLLWAVSQAKGMGNSVYIE